MQSLTIRKCAYCGCPTGSIDEPPRCKTCGQARKRYQSKCVHCNERVASRPRGLCHKCYYTPTIKAANPSVSKFATRKARGEGDPDDDDRVPEPPEPVAKPCHRCGSILLVNPEIAKLGTRLECERVCVGRGA